MKTDKIKKYGLLQYKIPYNLYSKAFFKITNSLQPLVEYKKYPTTPKTLDIDLSRMFTNNILGFSVSPDLQKTILPLLDQLDQAAIKNQKANTVINQNGVLLGKFLPENHSIEILIKNQIQFWLELD